MEIYVSYLITISNFFIMGTGQVQDEGTLQCNKVTVIFFSLPYYHQANGCNSRLPSIHLHKIKIYIYPVSIRRRFDVHSTSITLKRRRMDVNNVVCVLGSIMSFNSCQKCRILTIIPFNGKQEYWNIK